MLATPVPGTITTSPRAPRAPPALHRLEPDLAPWTTFAAASPGISPRRLREECPRRSPATGSCFIPQDVGAADDDVVGPRHHVRRTDAVEQPAIEPDLLDVHHRPRTGNHGPSAPRSRRRGQNSSRRGRRSPGGRRGPPRASALARSAGARLRPSEAARHHHPGCSTSSRSTYLSANEVCAHPAPAPPRATTAPAAGGRHLVLVRMRTPVPGSCASSMTPA